MRTIRLLCCLVMGLVAPGLANADVVVHMPGYSYAPFVTTTAIGVEDLEVDAQGNVYQVSSGDIRRITPGGVASPWSSAVADDIVFDATGVAYGAGRALCHCIHAISPSGAFAPLHADGLEWDFVAVGSQLYASVLGVGQGLYAIDKATGTPTLVVSGGPGPGGAGSARSMLVGLDGKLYETGFAGGATAGVYRLDGDHFTLVGEWPHGGSALAQDNQGIFYTSVTSFPPFGPATHEVWMLDPAVGSAVLLAEGTGSSIAVAYDRTGNVLYVQNGSSVYAIAKSATPTQRSTWGRVKEMYHR